MSAQQQHHQPGKIENLMQRLADRRAQLEEQRSPREKLNSIIKAKWEPKQQQKVVSFAEKLTKVQQVVKLELAIEESIKGFVPEEVTTRVKDALATIRKTDDLRSMMTVSSRYRDDVKLRQVIKFINAVYRYNRDIISGYTPDPIAKSRIKHSTKCPHCGETAKSILHNMMESKSVILP